jgi:di/tripeptidase
LPATQFLRANGTTLGGDDGAGVAACLALLEEESPLPPLECLFTVEEETDMYVLSLAHANPSQKHNPGMRVD